MFIKVTRWLLLGAVILLSAAGGLINHPEDAKTQAILSKVAYFEFVFVLLALTGMAGWLYFGTHAAPIKDGQMIVSIPRLGNLFSYFPDITRGKKLTKTLAVHQMVTDNFSHSWHTGSLRGHQRIRSGRSSLPDLDLEQHVRQCRVVLAHGTAP